MAPAVLLPGLPIPLRPAGMLTRAKSLKGLEGSARSRLQSCCCLASKTTENLPDGKFDNLDFSEPCRGGSSGLAVQRRALLAASITAMVGTPSAFGEDGEYDAVSVQTSSSLQSADESTGIATTLDVETAGSEGAGEVEAAGSIDAELASADSAVSEAGADTVGVEATGPEITKRVYFDISVDRENVGRIVIGLYGKEVPVAAARFAELAKGKQGVGYRRKDFYRITPTYFLNSGVRTFNVGASPPKITGGYFADEVEAEWAGRGRDSGGGRLPHVEGAVSLVVRDPTRPPPEQKLIARDGRLMMAEEDARPAPNGTEFAILTGPAPELDTTSLVIGRVIEGIDVARRIAVLPAVKDNSESGYFRVAKAIGDKRATVAERGFNRPYAKILIADSGVLD